MRISGRLLLSCTLATVALGAMVHAASARELAISNRDIRAIWAPVTVIIPESSIEFVCAMTLEGRFHSTTVAKVDGNLIGYITRAVVGHPCTGGGEMWVHNGTERPLGAEKATSLPWHMIYRGFTGTLPNMTEVRILLKGIRVTAVWRFAEMPLCLAVFGNATESIISEWKLGAGGRVSAIQFLAQPLVRRETELMISCQPNIRWNSSATQIYLLGTTTPITITLI